MLGADHVLATRMVAENGCYTGEIEHYVYGPAKAEAIAALAESEGYDLERSYAYSDSVTDIPMLETVGHPYAVNPDRALRKEAVAREWPVLTFSRPVRLHQRVPSLPPRPVLAAAAIGAAAPRRASSGTPPGGEGRQYPDPRHRIGNVLVGGQK